MFTYTAALLSIDDDKFHDELKTSENWEIEKDNSKYFDTINNCTECLTMSSWEQMNILRMGGSDFVQIKLIYWIGLNITNKPRQVWCIWVFSLDIQIITAIGKSFEWNQE